ncbi:MAG: hypothetical protein AAGB19_01160 [Cyanobacteria bacterium P01_F01_bin.3]
MKLINAFNGWTIGGSLILSGTLSLHAMGLHTKAVPQISNDGTRVGCLLYPSPLAPVFLLQGLVSIGAGALTLKRTHQRQEELAQQLAAATAPAESLQASNAPAVQVAVQAAAPVPQPVMANAVPYTTVSAPIDLTPKVTVAQAHSEIAKAIAASDSCLMLCASPGSGKTTLTLAAISELFGTVPGATFMGVVDKASKSDMCGLQSACPEAVYVLPDANRIPELLKRINALYREYSRRKLIADQSAIRKLAPVILYLGDYPSLLVKVSIWLSQAVDEEDKRDRVADLNEAFGHFATLLTNGRELNCKVWFDGQEFNAGELFPKGLSLKMSLILRECMNAVGLGLVSNDSETGRQRGSYGILENMLNGGNSPFSNSDRKYLLDQFSQLRNKSLELQRPLCITNANGRTEAEILPDLRSYEQFKLATAVAQANGDRVRMLLKGGALHDLSATLSDIPRRDELEQAIKQGLNQADAVLSIYGKTKGAGSQQECQWYTQVKQALGAA